VVPDVSKECSFFIFRGQAAQEEGIELLDP
jgi:hypothetical protein